MQGHTVAEVIDRKAPGALVPKRGTGMKMGNFLQFPGDSQVGGRQNGGICIRCVQERREGSPAACSIVRKGREV